MERRLTAVLAADVVGYSRLMSEDQAATLDALRQLRHDLLEPAVADFRGSMIKSMGDGWIIEFPSITDAIDCALRVQTAIAELSTIRLRIGVHIGEVVFEASDIFGDGVNVAARLEQLAPPGHVLLSDTAHNSLDQKHAGSFLEGGLQTLKNIPRPMAVWYWPALPEAQSEQPASAVTAAPQSEDRPSIAVLPFQNLSSDQEQGYFADGVTEDITTALSKFRWLFVIGRNSAFSFRDQKASVREIGKELGVRYVLEGSIRRAGERVRIACQLVDAADGSHIWADKFDGVMTDIFDLQDQVSLDVVSAIEPSLRQAEVERIRTKPTEDMQAYELYLRAQSHVYHVTDADNQEAIRLLSLAIQRDPGYAVAGALFGWCHTQRVVQNWPLASGSRQEALKMARQVLDSNRADAMALAYAGHVVRNFGADDKRANSAFERSMADNPNSATAHSIYAIHLVAQREFVSALNHAEQALRLSPRDTYRYSFHFGRAMALFCLERFDEATEAAMTSIADRDNVRLTWFVLIAALALNDDLPAARSAVTKLKEISHDTTLTAMMAAAPMFGKAAPDRFREGWLKAGLTE